MGKKTFRDDMMPAEYISLLFEKTSKEGYVYLPGWYYECCQLGETGDGDLLYECAMAWTKSGCQQAIRDLEELFRCFRRIAELSAGGDPDRAVLEAEGLAEVWDAYLAPFEAEERFGEDRIHDIDRRAWGEVRKRRMAAEIARGRRVTPAQKDLLNLFLNAYVEEEERLLLQEYRRAIVEEAEGRVGKGLCAADLIIRAQSLVLAMKLLPEAPPPDPLADKLHLHVPDADEQERGLRYSEKQFAAVYVIHRFADEKRAVDPGCEERRKLEELEEEGIDTVLSEPKKMNSRKSLAPLFVYRILRQHSSPARHLTQKAILDHLRKDPYEITLDRKALSRIIHGLEDSQLGVCSWGNGGTWYDPEKDQTGSE